jgi:metal-responsive CopG/Arc/MetJ family transcriptional regulator
MFLLRGITTVILRRMKTAISIPDAVFEEAERVAKRRGLSRSELYTIAIKSYVKDERFIGVRERLDSVYASNPQLSELDSQLKDAQQELLADEKW